MCFKHTEKLLYVLKLLLQIFKDSVKEGQGKKLMLPSASRTFECKIIKVH